MQITPATTHSPPTFHGMSCIQGFAEHLSFKSKYRITTQYSPHRISFKPTKDGLRLGLSQMLHELDRVRVLDGLFIDTAHLNAMGE